MLCSALASAVRADCAVTWPSPLAAVDLTSPAPAIQRNHKRISGVAFTLHLAFQNWQVGPVKIRFDTSRDIILSSRSHRAVELNIADAPGASHWASFILFGHPYESGGPKGIWRPPERP